MGIVTNILTAVFGIASAARAAGKMILRKKSSTSNVFPMSLLLWGIFTLATIHHLNAAQLKPRLVVLTDIAPGNVEPDDHESMVRLLAYADQFEIEGLIACSGWNSSYGSYPASWMDILKATIDAYEKDAPNLTKRSGQTGFSPLADESKQQELGYWPSPEYLRSRAMLGSLKLGYKELGDGNDSPGSDFLVKLADEDDERPIWVTVWGGANTFAQAIWRVKKERTVEQLKAFLHKYRIYTICDQDVPFPQRYSNYPYSSHQWMRREFEKDLLFIWDECAVEYQVSHGKARWADYQENIQGHGNLGAVYPNFKWGVEGDTPSFLYVMPNGLSNPESPGQANWGGYFVWMQGQDEATYCYSNNKRSAIFDTCTKYVSYFYQANFNDFAARMDWAKDGSGNRNPVVVVNGDSTLNVITIQPLQGTSVTLDASGSYDPDGDKLTFKWWVLPEAGTYTRTVTVTNANSNRIAVDLPADSEGKSFHIICEVTDNGTPNLTGYRRIIFEPTDNVSTNLKPLQDKYIASGDSDIEAESAESVGGASRVADGEASGGYLVGLTKAGQGIRFTSLPAGDKLAIRYASVDVGTISIAVNDQPARKVNIHSSGALTGSFLHAIVDVAIDANAMLTISLTDNDIAVNIDRIIVGDGDMGLGPDIWNLPPLPVAAGPYSADWRAISRIYAVPQWWRDAKFGAWAHWDPQSMPEMGDWYARGMYQEGGWQYNYHLQHFGHPSEYGYKDICHNWVIDRWKPDELMDLFVEMGARYLMAMGVHHDNFDCWDSKYQPWNSVNVGPQVDVVGTWEKAARRHGLRFGIGFHNSPGRTWGQFMPVRYTSDKKGPKQGESYDAMQTILDGKGKWWEGMDPVDLYGPPHTIALNVPRRPDNDPLLSPFANQFMWRVDDAVTKYHPDVIYFDEHAGDSQVDLGVHMGLGFLGPQLAANYYNKSLQWNHGEMNVVLNLKGVGGRYDSFQNSPELLPLVDRSLVKSTEAIIEPEIMAYSFQTETTIAPWHYQAGQRYMDAKKVIGLLMENVCRNGTMLLNITQHGRGNLDTEAVQICKDVGAWLKVNGEAVYSSRPFEVYGEEAVRYTRNKGNVYAAIMEWKGGPVTLKALHAGGTTLGKVSQVEMLGSDFALTFVQDEQGLTVTPGGTAQPLPGIANRQLASDCRVLRITHDKGWFNDDDPGATYPGWIRRCNLVTGDFNNDLTTSDTPGDVWSCSFTSSSVAVIAPKEAGAGNIEVQIDGEIRATVGLSTMGMRQAQQKVCEITSLAPGKHAINIVNRGPGPVAIDAIIVR